MLGRERDIKTLLLLLLDQAKYARKDVRMVWVDVAAVVVAVAAAALFLFSRHCCCFTVCPATVVLPTLLLLMCLCVAAVASEFRLCSETAPLNTYSL